MGVEVTGIPDFWDEKFHSLRVPPGDDQPLTEETVDSGATLGTREKERLIIELYSLGRVLNIWV